MYRYDEFDEALVRERVAQFSSQVERRLDGSLTEEEFRPLRLMNGVYLQLHAYMLRVAIPYGTLSSMQLRQLAHIAEKYDQGYGHFTTRQNIQFNWPKLSDIPAILSDLADVNMHAIQTSGNCIRNVTTDAFAGAAADEVIDPRPTAELLRQWSTLHPEFGFLPRKFKIAVTGSPADRAAIYAHDIGLQVLKNDIGEIGYKVIIGGGLGRTPILGKVIKPFLEEADLLPFLQAALRVYNRFGRRDNKYKARIKILTKALSVEKLLSLIEKEINRNSSIDCSVANAEHLRIQQYFEVNLPEVDEAAELRERVVRQRAENIDFDLWYQVNTDLHKKAGYRIATVSLKPIGGVPGDASAQQMRDIADLADRYGNGELRVSHKQNLVIPHLRESELFEFWQALVKAGLATANKGLISDMIACPGLDYCNLATARSIPIAQSLSRRFSDLERQKQIGPMSINISGCINACGHHHLGGIGILGLEKSGKEFYQLTLGGESAANPSLGEKAGRGISADEIDDAVERLVDLYLDQRADNETFVETYRRIGGVPFQEVLYGTA